jgi:hypothetical protein
MNLWIDHWGESKFFALYDGNDLVGVFVYKIGAKHVKQLLERLQSRIDELERQENKDEEKEKEGSKSGKGGKG